MSFRTYPVAASAYRTSLASTLTHAFDGELVLCGKVKASNILEDDELATDETPTCTVCAKRMAARGKR
jgi:tRNA(Ile2) C34 agmatinyltransferase TiaS